MTTSYKLRLYDETTLKGEITDMSYLQFARKVNAIGVCQFSIPEDHPYAAQIQKNYRVEVWRRAGRAAWYLEETYIIRRKQLVWAGISNELKVTAVSGNWLLSTRLIAWAAGTNNRSAFNAQKAETVFKTLVTYNLASSATTGNGRKVAGNTTNTVQADAAGGNAIDVNCAYDNLLKTLQENVDVGGGDFDMVWTGSTWDFRWYAGQLGTDRTTELVFSLARGNLRNPMLTLDWMSEKTLAVIGGQGEGSARKVRTRQGTDWSTANQIEVFVDARDVQTGVANENTMLDTRGDTALFSSEAQSVLDFDIVQSENSHYGEDYFLGDLGTVIYADVTATVQITDVTIKFAPGVDEKIEIGVKNV